MFLDSGKLPQRRESGLGTSQSAAKSGIEVTMNNLIDVAGALLMEMMSIVVGLVFFYGAMKFFNLDTGSLMIVLTVLGSIGVTMIVYGAIKCPCIKYKRRRRQN